MSHIKKIKIEDIHHLGDLQRAIAMFDRLVFLENQTTHKYWADKTGECLHAIGVKDDPNAYEIGVVKQGAGYGLQWDSYHKTLPSIVGKDAIKLKHEISAQVAMRNLYQEGFQFTRQEVGSKTHIEAYR